MSASRLAVRFSDFKWSDKIAMRDFERKDPEGFRSEIIQFIARSSVQTETESYRLQMLGEFVGWLLGERELMALRSALDTYVSDDAANDHPGRKQFVSGLVIGERAKVSGSVANKQLMDPEVVYPD
ncbi:MAG: hypothetical protein AAGC82_06600 [Pseudomonadota bacterium]